MICDAAVILYSRLQSVSALCCRSYNGFCAGGVSFSDLWRRREREIDILAFAEEVSVPVICAAAIILAFAGEVSA